MKPNGAQCMQHIIRLCSAVCSVVPNLQFSDGAELHLCMKNEIACCAISPVLMQYTNVGVGQNGKFYCCCRLLAHVWPRSYLNERLSLPSYCD